MIFGDVDGDGLDDAILLSVGDVQGGSSFSADAISSLSGLECGQLTTARTGYGAQANVHYETLAHLEADGRSAGTMPLPLQVVVGIDTTVPGATPEFWSKSYFYDNPVYDQWRHELRGFTTVRTRTGVGEYFADVATAHPRARHHLQEDTEYYILGCSAATDPTSCNPESDEARQRPALPFVTNEFGDSSKTADLTNPYVAPLSGTYRSTTFYHYAHSDFATGLDGRIVQHVYREGVDTYLYDDAPFVSQQSRSTTHS